MDIERIARKLSPLMPQRIKQWRQSRDLADAEMRALLDRQLLLIAQKELGDFRTRTLLSMPPKKQIKGPIHLGTLQYHKDLWPVGISKEELLQNLCIFGRSGAGKTNAAFHLLLQLEKKNIPFLFLDWKRTARHLLPQLGGRIKLYTPGRKLSPLRFNPFVSPPGLEQRVYLDHVADVLGDAYTLGEAARSVLQKAMKAASEHEEGAKITADILLGELEKLPDTERIRGWKVSAARALESVNHAQLGGTQDTHQDVLFNDFFGHNTIIELDALSAGAKKFIIPLLCLWLFYATLGQSKREEVRLVIFIEEAHHILFKNTGKGRESLIEMLLRQCRELGICFVIIDQHVHLISAAALGNTYTSLCLNMKDPTDIKRTAALCLIPADESGCLSELAVGSAVVKLQDRWTKPILISVPQINVTKGAITDASLEHKFILGGTLSAFRGNKKQETTGFARSRSGLNVSPYDFVFLQDILLHPNDGVDRRYKRIGWSADKGNRSKNRLITASLIEQQRVLIGRTHRTLLRITNHAQNKLGLTQKQAHNGSLEHEYWKRTIADQFKKQGYDVTLEAPRTRGRVDILAVKEDERIAIEIETGKSDVVLNVRKNLLEDFDIIIIVCVIRKTYSKVLRELTEIGLLLPKKVRLVHPY